MDGTAHGVLETEGQNAHPEKEVFYMKKALAGLLIFGMVSAAMVVPAAAAGWHGGGNGGCHRTWVATQTATCPWSGEDCPWDGQCGGWGASGLTCADPENCPWDGQCSGWCTSGLTQWDPEDCPWSSQCPNGGVCDGTGWARHHG